MRSAVFFVTILAHATATTALAAETIPRAVEVARTTEIPACEVFVDAAAAAGGKGAVDAPHATIAAAVTAAQPGAVICVAEGTYAESLSPGAKHFTLAGGFQRGKAFTVRDSAAFVTRAQGQGGSFVRFEDPSPTGDQLTVIDGFEITGYSQAVFRDFSESQRFDLTNNFIHGNTCADQSLAGAGFALNNVSGTIRGNVIQRNACGRGGAGFLNDSTNKNTVLIEGNLIDGNAGTEPSSSHGGALYLFTNKVTLANNIFTNNTVTQWGGGLFIGAYTEGGQQTSATLSKNVYRANRAGNGGGGFFCDDGATCLSADEVYEKNCGGNILLDSGSGGSGPTIAKFDRLTNIDALEVGCAGPGTGVRIDKGNDAADAYTFTNAVFQGNAKGRDFTTACQTGCNAAKVTVTQSKVQTDFLNGGINIAFDATSPPPSATSDPGPAAAARSEPAPAPKPRTGSAADPGPTVPTSAAAPAPQNDSTLQVGKAAAKQREPAVARGGDYMGFPEKFNRYYTDPTWKPSKVVYVSPDGSGNGASRDKPMPVEAAVKAARPGTKIHFVRGAYIGCFEFSKANSGTYDDPIVLYAERNEDGSVGVTIACCSSGRQTCFNFEAADYIAVDGFELTGGKNGVRMVGADYTASQHSRGNAVLGCHGHDQSNDPFFSGHSDWAVWERNLAHDAKKGAHGIHISNGSDWNIVRFNETHSNASSDLEINADPKSVCAEAGVKLNDSRCDAYAGEGEGGQGASDYFLIDSNFFHNGNGSGPNFASVRRSIVRNNIFGAQARHNVTFWQDTKNPKLGSSDNKIIQNLFISTGGHGVKFENNSTRNEFANNVLIGVRTDGGKVLPNRSALLMEVDGTVEDNVYRSNLYSAGTIKGRSLGDEEKASEDYAPGWFEAFSAAINQDPKGFTPTADAPFLGAGVLLPAAPIDRNGTARPSSVDLGPIERP